MGKVIRENIIISLIVIIILIPITVFAQEEKAKASEEYAYKFQQIMEMIKDNYFDESISEKELFEAAVEGMFNSLDKYSEFFNEKEKEKFNRNINQIYVGIGVELTQANNYVIVNKVFKDGSAYEKGVKAGDIILKIDGESAQKLTPSEVADRVLGEEGTDVRIVFERNEQEITLTLTRAIINIETVEIYNISSFYKEIDEEVANQIGYISITSFARKTDEEFKEAINILKEQGVQYLILDLRSNSGGYVSQAVNICKEIIPKGPIMHFINNDGEKTIYSSQLEIPPFEIVALIDEESASATEFLAAAIKESGVGVLVGENTYGKGVAQYIYSLGSEYMVKLTQEEFRSRDGNIINGVGVSPNYEIKLPKLISSDRKFHINDENEAVFNIENILMYLGYKVDEPDLIYDKHSFEAIIQFQKDTGIYPYGVCDYTTQKKLNQLYIESFRKNDIQRNKALDITLQKIREK